MTSRITRYAVLLAGAACLAGCSGQGRSERGAAAEAARQFGSVVTSDPERACEMLAPATRDELEADGSCAQSLSAQQLPEARTVRTVETYAKDAIVRLDQDTVFLARFDDGWRVTAAGCTADGDRPYDCAVKGR
jgi:hypothetical protein